MSRSFRRTPIFGNTIAASDNEAKRRANRALRRKTKPAVAGGTEVLPALRELSNRWEFAKDGKQYCPEGSLRK